MATRDDCSIDSQASVAEPACFRNLPRLGEIPDALPLEPQTLAIALALSVPFLAMLMAWIAHATNA